MTSHTLDVTILAKPVEKFSHIPTSLKDTIPTHFPEGVSKSADYNDDTDTSRKESFIQEHDTMEDENDAEKDIAVTDKPIAKLANPESIWGN